MPGAPSSVLAPRNSLVTVLVSAAELLEAKLIQQLHMLAVQRASHPERRSSCVMAPLAT